MARISVKYPIGTKVKTFQGIEGIITAVFIRGKNHRCYEFSYTHDGNPTSNTVEEIEIEPSRQENRLGFNKTGE